MIPRLAGWQWIVEASHVVLLAPDVDLGAIRYLARQRPLAPIAELVRRRYPRAILAREAELMVTDEGEYAALAIADVRVDGCALRVVLGFVLGDDDYACIEGISSPARTNELAASVRALLVAARQQRGCRRRRFRFAAPPWLATRIGDATAFVSPDRASRITVYPAVPIEPGTTPAIDLQRLPGEDIVVTEPGPSSGFRGVHDGPPIAIMADSGLAGTRVRVSGRWESDRVERDIVVLCDERYAYAVELVSTPARITTAATHLEALVSSIEPIPRRRSAAPLHSSLFQHWTE